MGREPQAEALGLHTLAADSPAVIVDCDIADAIPTITAGRGQHARAVVLVRIFTEPIGALTVALHDGRLEAPELATAIAERLEYRLRERFEDCGLSWPQALPLDGLQPVRPPRFLSSRDAVMRAGPEITVAVCTRGHPDSLSETLASIRSQEYPRLRTLVVDNAPEDDRTLRLVAKLARETDIDYVVERRPGLSWARNRAIDASESEVIAWADDDDLCDRWWTAELARAFVEIPDADAVTGLAVPRELETSGQAWLEQYSGLARGRGFQRAVFTADTLRPQSALYPRPPFGIGANMAFRRIALERIGRFDTALGAGTPTAAGEDTAAFSTLLLAGGKIVYQPTAIVRHRHRRDDAAARELMRGYGRGLTAYYTSMVLHRPSCAVQIARLSRGALREQLTSRGRRSRELGADFPPGLLRANRRGLVEGPFMYARARRQARRLRALPDAPGALADPPTISVVVPTDTSEPEQLQRCVASLRALDYPDYEVIVVENRPAGSALIELPGARVVGEPRPGGSAARNAGLALASGEIVAFTDDDVVADPGWLREIAARFAGEPDAAVVTGLILPLELDTPARILFEQSGSGPARSPVALSFRHAGSGRMYRREVATGRERVQSLYAAGELGQGSNMAVRAAVLQATGGFDEALGPGTPARAGEDLALLLSLIERGFTVAYEPAAVVYHSHRETVAELEHQIHSYGVGFTAMLTALAIRDPALLGGMLRVVPAWLRSLRDPRSAKNARRPPGYPRSLARTELVGMLAGPFAYAHAVWRQRRWQP
ncbi:MAG: glycosyltransferase [Solirubrobacteraceae bacterium]